MPVPIVEPLAGFVAPWWNRWRDVFEAAGGRAADWRFPVELPASWPSSIARPDWPSGADRAIVVVRVML